MNNLNDDMKKTYVWSLTSSALVILVFSREELFTGIQGKNHGKQWQTCNKLNIYKIFIIYNNNI